MRKSLIVAIVVEIIVLIAAFAFSVACLQFGVGRENLIPNIVMVVLWVLVAGVLLFVFWWRSLVREEMRRRFFMSEDWVYNYEIGYAPLKRVVPNGDAYGFVTFAADALAKMSYGFEVADVPEKFDPKFLISSRVFRYHFSGGDEEMGEKAEGVVVDEWRGTLEAIKGDKDSKGSYEAVGQFENARELARLLEDNGAFGDGVVE